MSRPAKRDTLTAGHKRLAASLGVTASGLSELCRAIARKATVRGMAGEALKTRGLAGPDGMVTDAGRELAAKARRLGW